MKHQTTEPNFRKLLAALPKNVRQTARKNYNLLKQNPRHPSLDFKKLGGMPGHFSVRAGLGYRAHGKKKDNVMSWYWIGGRGDAGKIVK